MARKLNQLRSTKFHKHVESELGYAGLVVEAPLQETYTRMLRIGEVSARTGLSKSQIHRMVGDLNFPEQIKVSPGVAAWVAAEIETWLQQRIAATRNVE